MLNYNSNRTIGFTVFDQFPELICAMSARDIGDMNVRKFGVQNVMPFLDLFNIPLTRLRAMKQMHSNALKEVDTSESGQLIESVDGLISREHNLYLGVNTADCLPIFFNDPDKKIVGVVHTGWKGTLGKITQKMIKEFIKQGSSVSNIYVAIGPHIGGCCYNVKSDRARLYLEVFKQDALVAFENDGEWFIDLGMANKKMLIESGVLKDHIDAPITCTSCQNDLFFSFRKDSRKTFGEMLGVIGINSNNAP